MVNKMAGIMIEGPRNGHGQGYTNFMAISSGFSDATPVGEIAVSLAGEELLSYGPGHLGVRDLGAGERFFRGGMGSFVSLAMYYGPKATLRGVFGKGGLIRNWRAGRLRTIRTARIHSSQNISRGTLLREKLGIRYQEYLRFRGQGYNAAGAARLVKPYTGEGQHFIYKNYIDNLIGRFGENSIRGRFLTWYRDCPLNVKSGRNMNTGRFYEFHARLHASPKFGLGSSALGMRMPRGAGWRAANVTPPIQPYGHIGYLWHGSPWQFKAAVGAGFLAGGGGTYAIVSD